MSWLLPWASALAMVGCDGEAPEDPPDPELVAEGQRLYDEPIEGGNTFACATCHAMDEGDGPRRPGHALGGATRRASFKNGELETFGEATNSCLIEWMNADPWMPDDPRLAALEAFVGTGSGAEDEIEFEIVEPPAQLDGGDAEAGRTLFNDSCVVCHGQDGEGTQRAIAVSSGALEPSYAARRIRTSGRPSSTVYDGLTGGVMPFWAADRLSDDELRDMIAYLSRNFDANAGDPPSEPPPPDPPPTDPPPPDPPPTDPPPSGCGNDHPMVGQVAVLEESFHDVGGIAEIIDNCTIEIREFTFDGEGIDVQIYGGFDGQYDDGFSISDNLVRSSAYAGETLTVTLPSDRSLDEIGGVSVWCVPVGVDFGSGTFE